MLTEKRGDRSLAYIGNAAVFDFGQYSFMGGLAAMYAWRSIYWSEQVSMRTRALLMFDWVIRWVLDVRCRDCFASLTCACFAAVYGGGIYRSCEAVGQTGRDMFRLLKQNLCRLLRVSKDEHRAGSCQVLNVLNVWLC